MLQKWTKKKIGKKNEAAQLATILATRWTGNRIVFMDSLISINITQVLFSW